MISMENILSAHLGESSSVINARFKKTIMIRQYEPEQVELSSELKIEEPLSGAERALLSAVLLAQLEYTAYVGLTFKEMITQHELAKRKKALEDEINALKAKAESVSGKKLDKYFHL